MPATLDARTLRDAMSRYLEALDRHREEIDSLNVFPVPDGDTGTNMLLTQQAVEEALRELDGAAMPEVAEAISRAALLGARGNSGVILSQVLRGMCARLSTKEDPGPVDLAEALAEAADQARRAVANPVEGTMLTVLRDAAEAAGATLAQGETCEVVARAALEAATASLERTRQQLPALAAAGVVDAGGKGVVLLFDALASALSGTSLSVEVGPSGPVGRTGPDRASRPAALEFAYEVMYLLDASEASIPALKERLGALGDSLVVVGGGGLFNVHVHTNDPGKAVEEGIEAGRPREIRITDLGDQVDEACLATEARGVRVEEALAVTAAPPATQACALVAVAEGEGLAEIFRSLGADVIEGGPGRNPAVAELLAAIDSAPAPSVILLPNHHNVAPAAELAAARSSKDVRVVPAATVPQGLSAASRFDPAGALDDLDALMREGADEARGGHLARAVRAADTDAGHVRMGDWVGVIGERIVATGADVGAAAVALTTALGAGGIFELLSLYVGADAGAGEAAEVEAALRGTFPKLELEVQRAGQPRYSFLIGLE